MPQQCRTLCLCQSAAAAVVPELLPAYPPYIGIDGLLVNKYHSAYRCVRSHAVALAEGDSQSPVPVYKMQYISLDRMVGEGGIARRRPYDPHPGNCFPYTVLNHCGSGFGQCTMGFFR